MMKYSLSIALINLKELKSTMQSLISEYVETLFAEVSKMQNVEGS
jgi:hypothetical protein